MVRTAAAAPAPGRRGNLLTRSLGTRLLLAVVAALAVGMGVIYLVSRAVVLGNFTQTEQELVTQDVGRIRDTLQADVASLGGKISDWAAWDDTYA
jgi:sensor domain CHASE-containing protein